MKHNDITFCLVLGLVLYCIGSAIALPGRATSAPGGELLLFGIPLLVRWFYISIKFM